MIAWFLASHLVSTFAGGGLLKMFLGNLSGDLKNTAGWFRQHSIWLTVSLVLAAGWGIDHFISQRHSAKVEAQLVKANAELQRITSSKNAQQVVTREKIKLVTQRIHDADGKAKVIEQARLPGNCKTPPAILQADL